jgi:DNA-directed RNA polymerase sigma subunit (sigma70/sigma32)
MLNDMKRKITPLAMARMRRKGYTLQAIADCAAVSKERVRQILKKQGIIGRWTPQ